MKNYEEVTNSLLERRDRYEVQCRRNRKRVVGLAASFGCFCLVIGAGFLVHKVGLSDAAVPTAVADSVYPSITDYVDDKYGQLFTEPAAKHKIVIHSIDGVSSEIMNIALMWGDFIEMTREELVDYYGVDYFPEVPADLSMMENDEAGIFRRYGGTGEVYWDQNKMLFANGDFSRRVGISVNKGNRVYQQFLFFEGTEEWSVINNMEVLIGLTEDGYYYAEFMIGDVGFLVSGYGVTENEFVAIIESVIK